MRFKIDVVCAAILTPAVLIISLAGAAGQTTVAAPPTSPLAAATSVKPVIAPAAPALTDLANFPTETPAIQRMVQQGIMSPVLAGTFSPQTPLLRGDFVVSLQKLHGLTVSKQPLKFGDIPTTSSIATAVNATAIYMNPHLLCVGCALPSYFYPNQPITRAAFAVTAVNILAAQGKVTAPSAEALKAVTGSASDYASWPPGAQQHIAIAIENGLLPLDANKAFHPAAAVTRAAGAVALDTIQQRFSIPARKP
jgi:hypothetical protein